MTADNWRDARRAVKVAKEISLKRGGVVCGQHAIKEGCLRSLPGNGRPRYLNGGAGGLLCHHRRAREEVLFSLTSLGRMTV